MGQSYRLIPEAHPSSQGAGRIRRDPTFLYAAGKAMSTFLRRVIGAAALRARTYEEVEADRTATLQAMAVVVLSSLAAGLGSPSGVSVAGVLVRAAIALLSWTIWALITLEIGDHLLREPETKVDRGELLRTLGFATTPGLVRALGVVPGLYVPVCVGSWLWMLAALVVAVRQALDYAHTSRAILVCAVGWLVALGATVALGVLLTAPVS